MVAKTKKVTFDKSILSKARKAFDSHKEDETRVPGSGGQNLPPGIKKGVAKLVAIGFDVYGAEDKYKGKPYFYARGVCVAPTEFTVNDEEITTEGLAVFFNREPICDTPDKESRQTVEEHVDHVLNFLRLMGVDTAEIEWDDLEEVFEDMIKEEIYFEFDTWKSGEYVNHTWRGVLEDYEPKDSDDEVEEEEEDSSTTKKKGSKKMSYTGLGKKADKDNEAAIEKLEAACEEFDVDMNEYGTWAELGAYLDELEDEDIDDEEELEDDEEEEEDTEDEDSEDEEEEDDEEDDLPALGKAADKDDEEAQARLTELAEESELDPDDYETWKELAAALGEEEEAEEDEEYEDVDEDEEEEDIEPPAKGDTVEYKPPRKRSPVACEVTAVFLKKETCNLKNLDTEEVYKGVSFDSLIME